MYRVAQKPFHQWTQRSQQQLHWCTAVQKCVESCVLCSCTCLLFEYDIHKYVYNIHIYDAVRADIIIIFFIAIQIFKYKLNLFIYFTNIVKDYCSCTPKYDIFHTIFCQQSCLGLHIGYTVVSACRCIHARVMKTTTHENTMYRRRTRTCFVYVANFVEISRCSPLFALIM